MLYKRLCYFSIGKQLSCLTMKNTMCNSSIVLHGAFGNSNATRSGYSAKFPAPGAEIANEENRNRFSSAVPYAPTIFVKSRPQ